MDKNNGESYKVYGSGKFSWVKKNEIDVQKSLPINPEKISKNFKEEYVNYNNFESETPYFIWVDLQRCTVNVFKGSKKNYRLIKTMTCASGKDETPTVRGNFKIQDRGLDFYEASINMGAKYWVRFYGSYLFHSLPTDKKGNILDTTLGKQATHGCIRLSIENSKWIYDNIPKDTEVWVN
jgi:lipoprotein-anchoring transpeptidase ErfK/SrfK